MNSISGEQLARILAQDETPPATGSGSRLGSAVIIVTAIFASIATCISLFSIWLQLKNYRKPILQRYVVRILLIVPLYAISSWWGLKNFTVASIIDPIRDIYEGFVIYCFFELLVNYLGGERDIIMRLHGRGMQEHVPPFNYIFPKVDISNPRTFLWIKRGILQYTVLKPFLAFATIIMKATHTFEDGYIGLTSGYFWSGLLYNLSVTISLYSLGFFWLCLYWDLKPFRPVPKFLTVKLVIFASYWQGFFLSVLLFFNALPSNGKYTADNLALAIQDALICFEMPLFAIAHWYAFSHADFRDFTMSTARLPVLYALRDAFGFVDLWIDCVDAFQGRGYEYRLFEPTENDRMHTPGAPRLARIAEGLRYQRGGEGKYWLPVPVNARTGLLSSGGGRSYLSTEQRGRDRGWWPTEEPLETEIIPEDEQLFNDARALEFGDYNFPVIPDEAPWMRGSGIRSSSSSLRSGHYQSVPAGPSTSSSSRPHPPSRGGSDKPIPTKPPKRIKPSEVARTRNEDLPEGCVDVFIAESESSEEESDDGSGKNVWRKMKGRLKSDINDFTTNGGHLQ